MTTHQMNINSCPHCGREGLKKVQGDWTGQYRDRKFTVAGLEYYECLRCGEKIYDPQAMRKIEANSPAFISHRRVRKSA